MKKDNNPGPAAPGDIKKEIKRVKKTFEEARRSLENSFEASTLLEQATEILRYLDSAHPAQTIVPDGRVELLRRSLSRFGDLEKENGELAVLLMSKFSHQIVEGSSIFNAIRLLEEYTGVMEGVEEAIDIMKEALRDAK